jgi:hypothetical protein
MQYGDGSQPLLSQMTEAMLYQLDAEVTTFPPTAYFRHDVA